MRSLMCSGTRVTCAAEHYVDQTGVTAPCFLIAYGATVGEASPNCDKHPVVPATLQLTACKTNDSVHRPLLICGFVPVCALVR